MGKVEYTTINLPKALVEEMKVWKMAYSVSYGRAVTYEEIIRGLLDNVEDIEPGVYAELAHILENNPELEGRMGVYCNRGN